MNPRDDAKRPEADGEAPGELHTQADDEPALTRPEAEVAGIVPGMVVYGDSSLDPNADDKRDSERAEPGEHF
jgi:hypothetical protein